MHTNLKAVTLFIATAIYPLPLEDQLPVTEQMREDILYDTVDTLMFTADQKADLYARLADGLKSNTKYADAIGIIERAIHACQYPG